MAGYQPRRRGDHADVGPMFPRGRMRPPAGGGGVVTRAMRDALNAEADRQRKAAEQARRQLFTGTGGLLDEARSYTLQPAQPKPVPFVDWGSSTGCEPRTPNVFERLFGLIRSGMIAAGRQPVAAGCAIVVGMLALVAAASADVAVIIGSLTIATLVVLPVGVLAGRRQHRRQVAAEWAAIAARADEQNQQWMTDPEAYRRQIEGNDR